MGKQGVGVQSWVTEGVDIVVTCGISGLGKWSLVLLPLPKGGGPLSSIQSGDDSPLGRGRDD